MGIALKELIDGDEIDIKDLAGKTICIDTPVLLYQFLTTIRQADGTYFTDKEGRVTSHLIGISSRIPKLMQQHLKLIFVFDGKAPQLKRDERERRKALKEEAMAKYQIASEQKDLSTMKKYASQTVRVTPEILAETQELLSAFGIPWMIAPSEAEAQSAYMVKRGDAYAVSTQDTDALLFGGTRIVRNLSLLGKHKRANALAYQTYKPEMIELATVLNTLGIDHEQFILLSILVGTDFNIGGVKGIGPKNALKLVKEHRTKEALIQALGERITFNFDEVYSTIRGVPITDQYSIAWTAPNAQAIKEILLTRHNFSPERVQKILDELKEYAITKKQTSLNTFFGG